MKFFGKGVKGVNKGYFGLRRCSVCNDELRDVDLVEMHEVNYVCFVPVRNKIGMRILVCKQCNSYMEINNKLWEYYNSYYNRRFNKTTTDNIVKILNDMSSQMAQKGVKLNVDNKADEQSLDLIYKGLTDKYKVWENIEEIISVFFKD
ncbi:MAG: hypothetical protein IJ358_01665 [Clostridia bacterium]|nr:hypothetical protein [Clostridia bacterium]